MSLFLGDPEDSTLEYRLDDEGDDDASEESDEKSEESDDEEEDESDSDDKKEDEEDEEDEEESDEEFTPEQKSFLKLLINPNTRQDALISLAKSEGIDLSGGKKAKKEIEEEIREIMGDDVDQIPAVAWKAIDKIVERRTTSIEEKTNKKFDAINRAMAEKESQEAADYMLEKYPDYPKYKGRIEKLMREVNPAQGVSMKAYLRNLYRMAKGASLEGESAKKKTERIEGNRKDANLRASSGRDDRGVKTGSRKMSLDEAITHALQQRKKARGD